MTRDEVCQEFGAWYRGEIPEEVHWRAAEAMADEIVRLRAILAMLWKPDFDVLVSAMTAWSRTGDVPAMLHAAIATAEREVASE